MVESEIKLVDRGDLALIGFVGGPSMLLSPAEVSAVLVLRRDWMVAPVSNG